MIESSKVQDISREVTSSLSRIDSLAKATEHDLKNVDPRVSSQFQIFNSIAIPRLRERYQSVEALLRSPLYVGFIGKYSHGKTSLVNALFELSGNDLLPTGKGVVSSCVTRVEFDDSLETQERRKISPDGVEEIISTSGNWQGLVDSREFDSPGLTPGYIFKLPGRHSDLAKQFTRNNIAILDLPGLGGPFFEDQGLISSYLIEMDLIAVVIKATEIVQAATVLNSQLREPKCMGLPKLVVVSFWDEAENSAVYANCRTNDERAEECRKRIQDAIPCLSEYIGDAVFTSAGATSQGMHVLRDVINRRVSGQNLIVPKAKKETPTIFHNRINACRRELRDLSNQIKQEVLELERAIASASQTSQQGIDLQKLSLRIDRATRYGKERFKKDALALARRAITSFNTGTVSLRDAKNINDLDSRIEEIVDAVNKDILTGYVDDLRDKYEYSIHAPLRSEAIDFLHTLELRNTREVTDRENEIDQELSDVPEFNVEYSKPNTLLDQVFGAVKTVRLTISDTISNPSTVLSILGAIGCLLLSKVDLPLIGSRLEFLFYIAILLFAVAGVSIYKTWKEINRRNFKESVRKVITKLQENFARETMKKDVYLSELDEDIEKKKLSIIGILNEVVDPINTTINSVKASMDGIHQETEATIEKLDFAIKTL